MAPPPVVTRNYTVATDSTTYCTFGTGTGVLYTVIPADGYGKPLTPAITVSYGDITTPGTTTQTPGGGTTVARGIPVTSGGGTIVTLGTTTQTPGGGTTVAPGTPVTSGGGTIVTLGTTTQTPGGGTTSGATPPTDTPPPTIANSTPTSPPTDTPPTTTANNTPTPTPPAGNTPTPTATTTDTTPPPTTPTTTPTDTPTAHVTIYIKASQAVLEGGQTGEPIEGQIVKLVLKDKPMVPSTAEQKTANDDAGHAEPAPQGTTGADGQAKFDVPSANLSLYGLDQQAKLDGKPVSNYLISVNLMKHDGGVAEMTGQTMPNLKGSLTNGNFLVEQFNIGNRTYVRIGSNTPYGSTEDLVEKFSKLLGVKVVVDICIIKEPGPPLGSEPASYRTLNRDLPQASVRLRKSARLAAVP